MADALLVPLLAGDDRCKALADLAARMTSLNLSPVLTNLVDACDPSVLPYLADQFHVMGNEGWRWCETDAQRRDLIKRSIELHRFKGTPWSIKHAFVALGFSIKLGERPEGAHWAEFDAEIDVSARGATPDMYDLADGLLEEWKPARCHLRKLSLVVGATGHLHLGAALISGEHTTVYPFQVWGRETAGPLRFACALHGAEVTTIFPQ